MAITATLELALGSSGFGSGFSSSFGGSAWVDKTVDLIRDPLRWTRGIFGGGPLDRIARPGSFTFTLDNTDQNSLGLAGLYSPGHANALPGFIRGVEVRLRLSDGIATRYVFRGRIRSIVPDPGVAGFRATTCAALDWLAEFAEFDAANLELQEAVMADDLLTAVIAALPSPPANVDFDTGSDEYPFAFDDMGGTTPKAMQIVQDIVQSEMGFLYLRGDDTDGETLRFENRQARAIAEETAQFTREDLWNEPGAFEAPSLFDAIVNDVEVRTVPRRVDAAATTVLISLDSPIEVEIGVTTRVFVDYRDPNNEAEFVGGKDMVALDPVTDWTANAAQNGSGADVTGDFTVVATYFGSRAMIELTNGGASTGYVRGPGGADGLQARGRGIYRYAPVISRGINQDSIDVYRSRQLDEPLLMPYQNNSNTGQGVAEYIAHLYGGRLFPRRARLATEADDFLVTQAIIRDVGDLVGWTEDQTGIDALGSFLDGIEQELSMSGVLSTWWWLSPADDTNVMIFDTGEFDENVFGFV